MSQLVSVNGFKWEDDLSRFNERYIKCYNENSNKGYFLKVDVEYLKKIWDFHKDLSFLLERKKIEKVEKLFCSKEGKEKYVIHIITLNQALNHGLILKSVNQESWLKPYIDMNTKLRKEATNEFEKGFFKLMNNSVYVKTMGNVRKHRNIKVVATEEKISKLVSKPNYHPTKYFSKRLLAIEMEKTRVKINKSIYLGMYILAKRLCMNFGMTTLNQNLETKQNYARWILIALLVIILQKIFLKTLPMMLKDGLIHLTMIRMTKENFQ